MNDLDKKFAGRFIVIDGPDGAGKSTQLRMLADWLAGGGVTVVETRDPGGTEIGDAIRGILLDRRHAGMVVGCEMLLYMASRTQLMGEVIAPATAAGNCVLCDRWVSATLAYQAAGGVLSEAEIMKVYDIAIRRAGPDLTIIIDIPAEDGLARLPGRADRMEAKGVEFHRRVRGLFLDQARRRPDRFVIVDGSGTARQVHQRVLDRLLSWDFKR